MPATKEWLSWVFLGSSRATEVFVHALPFQCATSVPPKPQMLLADSALAPSSPLPVNDLVQPCPLKCQVPVPGDPKTHTSVLLMARPDPIGLLNFFTLAQLVPLNRSTSPWKVNAHTLLADDAEAEVTKSPRPAGKACRVQRDPLNRKAPGAAPPEASNAHALLPLVVVTAVKAGPLGPATWKDVCQDAARAISDGDAAAGTAAASASAPAAAGASRTVAGLNRRMGPSARARDTSRLLSFLRTIAR